ncbi:MAG: hypothetical protein AAF845_02320 [Bacteroidota bacterium]
MPLNPLRLFQDAPALVSGPSAPDRPLSKRATARSVRGAVPRPSGMSAKEYEAFQLYTLGEAGVTHVRLRAASVPDLPEACAGSHGFVMTLEEAMLLQPIPHEVGDGQECLCSYRPAPPPATG